MLHSSFNLHRMCEVDLLISPATKAFIEQLEDCLLYTSFSAEVGGTSGLAMIANIKTCLLYTSRCV